MDVDVEMGAEEMVAPSSFTLSSGANNLMGVTVRDSTSLCFDDLVFQRACALMALYVGGLELVHNRRINANKCL